MHSIREGKAIAWRRGSVAAVRASLVLAAADSAEAISIRVMATIGGGAPAFDATTTGSSIALSRSLDINATSGAGIGVGMCSPQ